MSKSDDTKPQVTFKFLQNSNPFLTLFLLLTYEADVFGPSGVIPRMKPNFFFFKLAERFKYPYYCSITSRPLLLEPRTVKSVTTEWCTTARSPTCLASAEAQPSANRNGHQFVQQYGSTKAISCWSSSSP